ncbi:MAG: long-chain fatty acid--CoA ligase [Amphiplicatus sp.]|nr:long-chain fatty acid--CoA ligase [Amphiplicatus sp.]
MIREAILNADPHDPMFIIGTSGSTGTPKGVVETHFCVVAYAAEFVLMEPKCGSGASILVVGPFSSSSGTLVMLQFLVSGATIYIERQFKPVRALQLLVEEKITIFLAATIFFERIAALEEFKTADLSSLYFSQAGGARVSTSMLSAWREKGVILRQAYGCTEAGGAWAARDDVALVSLEKAGRGGMFTDYAIADDEGNFLPSGEEGEILVRGASVTPGYWGNDEATESVFKDGWLRTGDIGVMDESGNITFIDRKKDIIISGGLNVSAKEIEDVVAHIEGVDEVAVIAAADAEFGETPLVIIHGQSEKLSKNLIIERCFSELARYKVPRYVVFETDPLPRTTSGKISKPDLRAKYRNAHAELEPAR